jgi:hypothetical protein
MAEDVDELFGGTGPRPKPRLSTALALAIGGFAAAAFGLACTSLPGLLLVLGAWHVVESDLDRVESGFLAPEHRRTLRTIRVVVWILLGVVIALVLFQAVLLFLGFYNLIWSVAMDVLLGWLGAA